MKLFKGTQKTLIITDDDHFYSPIHCQTLYENLLKLEGQGVVGFRGWRIQSSMEWGVSILKPSFFGWAEDQFHVIHGWRIRRMYQVYTSFTCH